MGNFTIFLSKKDESNKFSKQIMISNLSTVDLPEPKWVQLQNSVNSQKTAPHTQSDMGLYCLNFFHVNYLPYRYWSILNQTQKTVYGLI